jgi:hypothetical protein
LSRRVKADLQKVTLNLRAGDWDYIESIAKPQGLATSEVVRILISNFVDKKRSQEIPEQHIDVKADL